MPVKLTLSSPHSDSPGFAAQGDLLRKDFISTGRWVVPSSEGNQTLAVSADRLKKWAKTFTLMGQRGVSVPLTVDHMEVRDPKTGETRYKRLTPGMAEAKRGDVVALFEQGNTGFCDVRPADEEAKVLMNRCPEVSLELTFDWMDGHGNYYDEAITAITLTPKPIIPQQQQKWLPVEPRHLHAGREDGLMLSLVAEPVTDIDLVENPLSDLPEEIFMALKPEQITSLRAALKLSKEIPDKDIESAFAPLAAAGQTEVDRLKQEAIAAGDRIVMLSRECAETKAALAKVGEGKVVHLSMADLEKDVDSDALDMAATAMTTRINALSTATPVQKQLLLSHLVGTPEKRNVIALSRKTAKRVGLPAPLAESMLSIFEAGNPVDMLALLNEKSGTQTRAKIELSREAATGEVAAHDPELTKAMLDRINGKSTASMVL